MRLLTTLSLVWLSVASEYEHPELDVTQHEHPETEIRERIDPIVTGGKLTDEHVKLWKAEKKRYEECNGCEALQPFPGD